MAKARRAVLRPAVQGMRSLIGKLAFCYRKLFLHTEPQVFPFKEYQMTNKALAILLAGAFAAAGAIAQQTTPPGAAVPPGTPGIATSPEQQKAQANVEMRKLDRVEKPVARSTETYPIRAQGKSANKAQAHVNKRDAKHPDRMTPKQGVTPESPGAK